MRKTSCLALLSVWLLNAPVADATESAPSVAFAPCRLEGSAGLQAIAAECGSLSVPENYDAPQGLHIDLYVARVRAVSQRAAPDPLVVIAGGPGMASTDFYASVAAAFARIRRERDIVVVDQRGTGQSNLLDCEFDEQDLLDPEAIDIGALARDCRDRLVERADLTQYTTSVAVRDLETLRTALAYPQFNLYGVSYGTRVAQHYAKRYPGNARTLILDGVIAPSLVLGPNMALDAEAALQRIFARCLAAAACKGAYGDPTIDYRALWTTLDGKRVTVSLPDPTTGAERQLEFGRAHLSAVLRLASYDPSQAALLPLALKQAHRDNNYRALAAQFLLISRSLDSVFAYGMHNSVACSEDAPAIDLAALPRDQLTATHMGFKQVEQLVTMCREWPRGVVDEDFRAPLRSSAAALLLSGGDDPVTPPVYATEAQQAFTDSLHLILPGFGHGQLSAPCVDKIMADFVAAGSARQLDVRCTDKLLPTPFFTSPAGPAP
ncbi:MAG: alpha/beta fold hydrolase [Steroidobacteraceae bacterium]